MVLVVPAFFFLFISNKANLISLASLLGDVHGMWLYFSNPFYNKITNILTSQSNSKSVGGFLFTLCCFIRNHHLRTFAWPSHTSIEHNVLKGTCPAFTLPMMFFSIIHPGGLPCVISFLKKLRINARTHLPLYFWPGFFLGLFICDRWWTIAAPEPDPSGLRRRLVCILVGTWLALRVSGLLEGQIWSTFPS